MRGRPTNNRLSITDRDTHHQLAQIIRAGRDDGSLRNDPDPEDAAAVAMGMGRGIAGLSLNHPDIADRRRPGSLRVAPSSSCFSQPLGDGASWRSP